MADSPWAGITNLGAIDQKLYQPPASEPPSPTPREPMPKAKPAVRKEKQPRVAEKPSEKPEKRVIRTRHPFGIYQDQLDLLKKLSIKAKMRGETGSMSAMVRDALDAYLKDKKAA
jgi:hypothetical protein